VERRRAVGADHPRDHRRIAAHRARGHDRIIIAFNLGMAALIDRFGWFGFDQIAITWTRVLGLVLLAAGATLSLSSRLSGSEPLSRSCRLAPWSAGLNYALVALSH